MRKKRWRNRKGAGLLALALTCVLALSGTGALETRAAIAVDTEAKGSLKVDADDLYSLVKYEYVEGMPEGTDQDDLKEMSSDVTINLYQVATMDASGKYTAINEFANVKGLDLDTVDSETSASQWVARASAAQTAVVNEDGSWKTEGVRSFVGAKTTSPEYHAVDFQNLPVGLYLVGSEQVVTDNYVYNFTPYLVSMPGNNFYANGDDSWLYNVEMGLKAEQKARYGDLQIEKRLDSMSAMPGDEATFVFQIDITTPNNKTEQRIEALTFNKTGSSFATIEKIPAGSTVTVKEIYSGAGYELAAESASEQQVTIVANDEYSSSTVVASVAFENEPDGSTTGGYGVRNNFALKDGIYYWTGNGGDTSTATE